jgi:hypothetical protein
MCSLLVPPSLVVPFVRRFIRVLLLLLLFYVCECVGYYSSARTNYASLLCGCSFAKELATINTQHPFEPLTFLKPALRITFAEGIALLREAGTEDHTNTPLLRTPVAALCACTQHTHFISTLVMYFWVNPAVWLTWLF